MCWAEGRLLPPTKVSCGWGAYLTSRLSPHSKKPCAPFGSWAAGWFAVTVTTSCAFRSCFLLCVLEGLVLAKV